MVRGVGGDKEGWPGEQQAAGWVDGSWREGGGHIESRGCRRGGVVEMRLEVFGPLLLGGR